MAHKLRSILCLFVIAVILASCSNYSSAKSNVSVWAVYWDLENALQNIDNIQDDVKDISCFAAYFNKDSKLFIPEKLINFLNLLKEKYSDNKEYYLSVVNDIDWDQENSQKNTEILAELFKDEKSINNHVDEIINLALQYGFDGIDLDYEAIRTNMELWDRFIVFCKALYLKASENDLKLRVILEPNAPLEKLTFPEGPQYVMMCYNLFGYDVNPGPKADYSFLQDMITKMSSLPGRKGYALATGGFDWPKDKTPTAITTAQAVALAEETDAVLYRSQESGALTFQYWDESGVEHTVWYADAVTLRLWQDIVSEGDSSDIMIWRIE